MRTLWATWCLAALIAGAAIETAGAQDFEDLVEDALERAPGAGEDGAGEDSAVPERLRVQPAPTPRRERRIRVIPAPEAAPPQEIIIQPAPDAAVPAPPRRVIIEAPPAAPETAEPERQAPAPEQAPVETVKPSLEERPADDAGVAPAPEGPKPYTPPRRTAAPETAEEPADAAAGQATGSAGDLAPPATEATGAGQGVGESPTEPQPTLRTLAAYNVEEVNAATFVPGAEDTKGPSAVVLKAQILLDRAGASPGVIDGVYGGNVRKAIEAVETVLGLPVDGRLDQEVWNALGGDRAADVLVPYTITAEDAAYPFLPEIPRIMRSRRSCPSLDSPARRRCSPSASTWMWNC